MRSAESRTQTRRRGPPGRGSALRLSLLFLCLLLPACGRAPGIYHTVHPGENLYRISLAYGVDQKAILDANDLPDASRLDVGRKLYIPGALRPKAVPLAPAGSAGKGGGGTATASASLGAPKIRRPRVPRAPAPPPAELPGMSLIWPIKGGKNNVSSRFGPRGQSTHDGIDIRSPKGTAVLAAEDGKVIYSDDGISGYGNLVIIKHVGRIATVYAHNDENLVRRGEIVEKGQVIAKVGRTGRATGNHLHFEVRNGKTPLDPLRYLP